LGVIEKDHLSRPVVNVIKLWFYLSLEAMKDRLECLSVANMLRLA